MSLQRYKPYVFLALAVVMALVTSIGIYSWLKSQGAPEGVAVVESEVRMIEIGRAHV